MKSRLSFRNAIGLGQIMATLLVVLPTLAFSVTFMLSYWNVMQVDYKLKLIANMAADYANNQKDLTQFSGEGFTNFTDSISKLCPKEAEVVFDTPTYDGAKGIVSITVEYTTPESDNYLGGKLLSTNIQTYSYHDQNISVTLRCPTL